MKNEKLMVKLIAGLVIAGVTLSAGATAFADTKDDTATNKIQTAQKEKREGFKRGGNKEGFHGEDIKTKLDAFVKDGTITQAQENKIVEFMNKKDEARKAEMEKVKAMTEEERKAYFEAKKTEERPNLFKELVDAGILNQTQADAAKKVLPQHKGPKGNKVVTPKASE